VWNEFFVLGIVHCLHKEMQDVSMDGSDSTSSSRNKQGPVLYEEPQRKPKFFYCQWMMCKEK
jgi:hypothetical protein